MTCSTSTPIGVSETHQIHSLFCPVVIVTRPVFDYLQVIVAVSAYMLCYWPCMDNYSYLTMFKLSDCDVLKFTGLLES